MHEQRTPVMIRVEASWKDQTGTLQIVAARMEDRSIGGACIRVKIPIELGATISIQGPWEQFWGSVKYCRNEGKEYVVGLQRGAAKSAVAPKQGSQQVVPAVVRPQGGMTLSAAQVATAKVPPPATTPARGSEVPSPVRFAVNTAEMRRPRDYGRGAGTRDRFRASGLRNSSPYRDNELHHTESRDTNSGNDEARAIELQAKQPRARLDAAREGRTRMGRKWFGLGPRQSGREHTSPSRDEYSNAKDEKEHSMPQITQPRERAQPQAARSVPTFQVELLAVEDIYRAAGIISPPKGYSVNKVVEMLHSEHIRSLSPEMRQAAVLMALESAGVPLAQVQQDAKARKEALDSYEAGQSEQVEAEWARKAEEVVQIQAELESIKAHYMARISRNLEGVAREKATFNTWQTMKQQEVESMAEAAELCAKAMVSKTASTLPPTPEVSVAGAGGKA